MCRSSARTGPPFVNHRLPPLSCLDGGKEAIGEVRKRSREADDGLRITTPIGAVTCDARRLVDLGARLQFLSRLLLLLGQHWLRQHPADSHDEEHTSDHAAPHEANELSEARR